MSQFKIDGLERVMCPLEFPTWEWLHVRDPAGNAVKGVIKSEKIPSTDGNLLLFLGVDSHPK